MVGLFGPTADDADRDYFQTWKNHALSGTLPVQISVCKFFFRRLAAPAVGAPQRRPRKKDSPAATTGRRPDYFCPPAATPEISYSSAVLTESNKAPARARREKRLGLYFVVLILEHVWKMIKGDILYAFYETVRHMQ